MTAYHGLKTVSLDASEEIARPERPETYGLDSPAVSMMSDFRVVEPVTVSLGLSLDAARERMRNAHVRSVLVVDAGGGFRGLLTFADLESRRALSLVSRAGIGREDITVQDVMTPREHLRAVPLAALDAARVGDLLETLKHEGAPHMLVVDTANHQLRGVISASDLARRLRLPVDILRRATSFREVVEVVSAGGDT